MEKEQKTENEQTKPEAKVEKAQKPKGKKQ